MQDPQERIASLEALNAALDARVTTLEERFAALAEEQAAVTAQVSSGGVARPRDEGAQSTEAPQGAISLVASVQIGEQRFKVRVQEQMQPFFEADPEQLAHVIASLGSPHRITIVRALCEGTHTAPQLQEALGAGSVGQLYHHLKELVGTGLVTQNRRGAYAIVPAKMMWISLILQAAFHLMPPAQADIVVPPAPNQGSDGGGTA